MASMGLFRLDDPSLWDGSLSASSPPLAVLSPRGSSVSKRRHCTFLPHFPELDRVPGVCCMCHTNPSFFKAFLACARFCSAEEYTLVDFSRR